VPVDPSHLCGFVAERIIINGVSSCLFPSGLAWGQLLAQDVEERRLYSIGVWAKNALVGEVVHWDSYSSWDVFERQQLAEGCQVIAAGVVPPNKHAVGWPPVGDLVEPQLAAEGFEAPTIVVICVVAYGGPASPRCQPGQPNGRRLLPSSSWGHRLTFEGNGLGAR
jgi:hypothetical protein